MCVTCGCDGPEAAVLVHAVGHDHTGHDHPHDHGGLETIAGRPSRPAGARTDVVALEERVLAHNDHLAGRSRAWLDAHGIHAVNLMSSPGSGKTSLLERTVAELVGGREVCVIEGDQETRADAERIARAGARAVQVNTGAGCHLDAAMVERALASLEPADGSLLFVENVGNLVCPALFDLGEHRKVVVISVTEGEDKPLKYPQMFAVADLIVINKTDLLPYVDFDVDVVIKHARAVNPGVEVIALSVRDGSNVESWYAWLNRI